MGVAEFAATGRMTDAEYRVEREALRAAYGDTPAERSGCFDQELARLFYRSAWTQEQLAKHEGKTQQWVALRLRLSRYLAFTTTVVFLKSLTERRFRDYWDRTDKTETNERVRFAAVQRLIESELTLSKDRSPQSKAHVAKAILDTVADGQWRRVAEIVTLTHDRDARVTEPDVVAVLTQMLTRQTYHTLCERRKGGTSWSYRIVRGRGRKIDIDVLMQELAPIVHALKVEGRKHVARSSPATVARLVTQLEAILERLATSAPLPSRSDDKEHDSHDD